MKSFGQRESLRVGCVLAGLSVAMGAFGAHALKQVWGGEQLQVFDTAIRYLQLHAFALLILGSVREEYYSRRVAVSFLLGIVLFTGSLLLLVATGERFWGAVTPIGGMSFLVGWTLWARQVARSSQGENL